MKLSVYRKATLLCDLGRGGRVLEWTRSRWMSVLARARRVLNLPVRGSKSLLWYASKELVGSEI